MKPLRKWKEASLSQGEQPAPQPRLLIIAAPSGAGKTTLCERLVRENPKIQLSISTTTRAQRPYEQPGVHYHFVSPEAFQKKIDAGDFAEWAEVHGRRYGTDRKVIDQALTAGKHVLFDIDVQGAMNLRKLYGNRTVLVFINPPSLEILEERLRNRKGDSAASIETRLRNAYNELAWKDKFDHQIVNDDLERAYSDLLRIVKKECL
ncbi:guanylate kinase [bacterium]|nr:guanylate kinase [bacterium]